MRTSLPVPTGTIAIDAVCVFPPIDVVTLVATPKPEAVALSVYVPAGRDSVYDPPLPVVVCATIVPVVALMPLRAITVAPDTPTAETAFLTCPAITPGDVLAGASGRSPSAVVPLAWSETLKNCVAMNPVAPIESVAPLDTDGSENVPSE